MKARILGTAITGLFCASSTGFSSDMPASHGEGIEYEPARIEAGLGRESREGLEALAAAYRELAKAGYDPSTKLVLLWRVGPLIQIEFRNRESNVRDGEARVRFDPKTGKVEQISIDG